jgi:hypothetical protein
MITIQVNAKFMNSMFTDEHQMSAKLYNGSDFLRRFADESVEFR